MTNSISDGDRFYSLREHDMPEVLCSLCVVEAVPLALP